ncbi:MULTISPECIES: FecR family protein [Methylosinus]|uniref:Iron dicitrate transport regulator FecR n=1 Tax=Methylosinus trichosporium (strain ATCC 35070 / NCIMB 11131 / UNIQEM 75 / OB3b) TaxID=595536 RepID=A0A2D2CYB3_METT3|nr:MULTISPECIES: FecR family protein [Methylosinus]ATQ67694.1 iron dicitrate transport regulator FecR [Methylosinus trichosporium OB3b]OBS53633.1 iron dicitrate transport regulator FecR [Methylosinus sp. 3S-1]
MEKDTDKRKAADDAAIDWVMRCNDGPLSKRERAAFRAWLLADEANQDAFDKISSVVGRLRSMNFETSPETRGKPPAVWLSAAAVALTAATLAFGDLATMLRSGYYTWPGETKLITLADGSRVHLDSRSAIAVDYRAAERRLVLLEGQAWFEVAADAARPFVVAAGQGTTTALGTAFDVSLDHGRTSVTVGEHRVAVVSGGRTVVVGEGEQSSYDDGAAAAAPRKVDLLRATSWRNGSLIFENATLGEVVEAFGRYHRGHVIFADPNLRSRRVTGVFDADDPVESLEEIEAALGLRMTVLTKYLIILYR